jgi:hypothetical protein
MEFRIELEEFVYTIGIINFVDVVDNFEITGVTRTGISIVIGRGRSFNGTEITRNLNVL